MKGKTITTIILLGIFLIAEINFTVHIPAQATLENNPEKTIIVSKNKGDYTSIQEAINNASEGTTILVKKGIYNETIDIKKTIYLLGENKDTTFINTISEENKYSIRLAAEDIIVKNFSITNKAIGLYATGIRVSAINTRISDCNIYDTPVGIAIWTSNNIIENCIFWGCKDEGIALIGSKYTKCENNTIINCSFCDNCDGIELQYSSNNKIINCEFYGNSHSGIDAIASSNNNNTIKDCVISENKVHGIYLSESSGNKITACSFTNNDDGDIVTNGDCLNNLILEKEEINEEYNNISQVVKNVFQSYYQSKNAIPEKNSSILSRILTLISNLIPSIKEFIESKF